MADNVTLNAGSGGATVRTDELSGSVHAPVSKILLGGDGVDGGFVSSSNPLPARLYDGAVAVSYATSSAVAAGGQATLDSDNVASGKVGKLLRVDLVGTVVFKGALYTVANGVASDNPKGVLIGNGHWSSPAREAVKVSHSASLGLDGFRLVCTNLDVSLPADVYAIFYFAEDDS